MKRERQLDFFTGPTPKQHWLINFVNPLIARLGKEFFAAIPKTPGIYKMFNHHGEIIYVGKAKCLRDRLRSYTRVNGENSSRKVMRLVHTIESIEWEELADEKTALLRENFLLRSLTPPFNVVNTSPHTYLFIHLKSENEGLRFHLSTEPDETYPEIYGAFKGRGLTYDAHKAMLRMLWRSFNECRHGFELPGLLTNRRRPPHHLLKLPEEMPEGERLALYRGIRRFFNGTSKAVLENLSLKILEREDLASFTRSYVQADLDTLLEFYERCAHRNRRIKRQFKIADAILPQDRVDDFLVLLKA